MYRIVFACLLFYMICNVYGEGPSMGKGIWIVNEVSLCPDEEYPWTLQINKTRVDRTTIEYDVYADLLDQIDEMCPIKMIICIYKDGGCKPYQTLSDDSTVRFAVKYAEKFIVRAFEMIDLPDWPIPKGEQRLSKYKMSSCEFPKYAPYGDFEATAIVVKNGQEVVCAHVALTFAEDEDGICPEEEEE